MFNKYKQTIWKFIRGDLATDEFERWVYENKDMEEIMGGEFYLEIISADYQSKSPVYELKQKLEEYIRQSAPLSCQCITLADTAWSHMGSERAKAVFATLKRARNFGDPLWWLHLDQCKSCRQYWLVAQEERQNDIFCFKRLASEEGLQIRKTNIWPEHFKTYEELLVLGRDNGCRVSFIDPLNDSSLIHTTLDLARNRPGISVSEIASLLNIDHDLAVEVCKRAISKEEVNISFPE